MTEECDFFSDRSPNVGQKWSMKVGLPQLRSLNSALMDMELEIGEPKEPVPVLMKREEGIPGVVGTVRDPMSGGRTRRRSRD